MSRPAFAAATTGRPRRGRGFTLIELLVALVVLGLLAVVAGPQVRNARVRAYVATMRADLRNLAIAQESYYYDHRVYAAAPVLLEARGFRASPDVSVTIHEATGTGWSASLTHAGTMVECALFSGGAAPVGAAATEGDMACA